MTVGVGDVVRVATTGTAPLASVWQNVWHYVNTGAGSESEANVLAAIKANYIVAWNTVSASMSDQYQVDTLEMWKWNFTTNKWEGQGITAFAPLVGLSAGDPNPHGVAAVGRYVTALARRQGRTFLPGQVETTIDNSVYDAAWLALFTNYMDEFTDALTSGGAIMSLCTFNLDISSPYYETTSVYNNVNILSNIPGYQRRRKPLVGI